MLPNQNTKSDVKTTSTLMFKCSLIFLAGMLWTGCCSYKQTICPVTNVPVNYPRSQKCAKLLYEDAVKTWEAGFKGDIDILGKVKLLELDIDAKSNAQLIAERLSSEDALMREVLKSATILLAANPCQGIVAYEKAMSDAANYKIRLATINADVVKSQSNKAALTDVLSEYAQGQTDGKNVGIIRGSLDKFYNDNKKYPSSLSELTSANAIKAIAFLGLSISYTRDTESSYSIRFAGQDGKMNTPDDKFHKGLNGNPVNG